MWRDAAQTAVSEGLTRLLATNDASRMIVAGVSTPCSSGSRHSYLSVQLLPPSPSRCRLVSFAPALRFAVPHLI
jgi:hypothetical protein